MGDDYSNQPFMKISESEMDTASATGSKGYGRGFHLYTSLRVVIIIISVVVLVFLATVLTVYFIARKGGNCDCNAGAQGNSAGRQAAQQGGGRLTVPTTTMKTVPTTSAPVRSAVVSTYIRWGRTTCPNTSSKLVYDGYVGGGFYNYKGAPMNYVCLPKDPQFAEVDDGRDRFGSRIYGAEYQFSSHTREKYFGREIRNDDVPCAVCEVPKSTVMLLPGRMDCYAGWTKEYHGYLSAGHDDHDSTSEYVCLDAKPESLPGGESDDNGRLFYFVEGVCGSLKCPPYVNGRELTCVVCTK